MRMTKDEKGLGLPHKLSFPLWFCDSKKSFKKHKDLLILGHPTYAGPPSTPPPSAKHVSCLGHSVQLPTVWKSVFSKIGRLFAESYLCNETSDRQNKYSLETPFLSRFFIFSYFLNLNQDFRANLQCKSCVQLPILWKTRFSQTLRSHIFATKCPTNKINIP